MASALHGPWLPCRIGSPKIVEIRRQRRPRVPVEPTLNQEFIVSRGVRARGYRDLDATMAVVGVGEPPEGSIVIPIVDGAGGPTTVKAAKLGVRPINASDIGLPLMIAHN